MDNFKELAKEYAAVELNEIQLEQFSTLANFLLETNKITNLTAIRDIDGVYIKHFLDSLTLIQAIPKDTKNIADIGSGAGFPGLAIAIAQPNIKVAMIESVGKKASFIESAIKKLELKNAQVINGRAEKLGEEKKYKEIYDVVTARAVADLSILVKYCVPFLRKGGVFISMKNINDAEIENAKNEISEAHSSIIKTIPISIPGLTPRQLIIICKNKHII